MATNPMQKRARVSFLLGMLITLIITGAVIGMLFMKLKKMTDERKAEQALKVSVNVLNKDVKSGEEIDGNCFKSVVMDKTNIPDNAIQLNKLGEKNIARIAMSEGTIVTSEMITIDDKGLTDDVRREEYNMIVLPIDLETGDYIDIRLMLPSGENYIVLSKQKVEVPYIDGYVDDTIYLNLTEDQILTMNSAIVEAYWINGSKLYANKFVEPGMQKEATLTYPPKKEVLSLIDSDPNVLANAKTELATRYNTNQRIVINNAIELVGEPGATNVNSKVQESIGITKEDRKEYLETLN